MNFHSDCIPARSSACVTRVSANATSTAVQQLLHSVCDMCEVCLIAPRCAVACVPCGHSHVCSSCTEAVIDMPHLQKSHHTLNASLHYLVKNE